MRAAILCMLVLTACAVPTPMPRQGGPADPSAAEAAPPPASQTLVVSADIGLPPVPQAVEMQMGGDGGMGGMQMGPDGGMGGSPQKKRGGTRQERRKPRAIDGGQP
jgi:hypothetical protein